MKNLNKIIEYGLYLLVFLLPWQTRWIIKAGELNGGYWEYGTVSLYLTDVVFLALLLLFAVNLFKNREQGAGNREHKIAIYWWAIAGLELFIFISIFFAPDKILAVYGYIRFLLGVGLFWLIVNANYKKIKLITSFLIGIAIQAGMGIWQFIAQSSFSSKWLGMAIHNANELGVSVIEIMKGERWLRAYGGLDHPNILGGILAVGIILLIGLMIKTNYKLQIKKLVFYYFLLVLFVNALFFSFSRSAWLAAIISILIMLFLAILQKKLVIKQKILKVILISGLTVFILFNLYNDLVQTRIMSNARLEVKSNTERMESYGAANKLIKNKWVFGVGIGNYTLAMQKEIISDKESWFYQPVHNTFLLIWTEIGIFGLLSFLSLIYYLFIKGIRDFKSKRQRSLIVLPILAALILMFLVDHWFWSLHFGVLFFWMIMGLMLREKNV